MAFTKKSDALTYQRRYRKENWERLRPYYVARNRQKTQRMLDYLNELKDKPCADCGEWYPPMCMDFDHVYGDKKLAIASAKSWATLLPELEKCEVVCANCHRLRTFIRNPPRKL